MTPRLLDRYLLREWSKIFLVTAIGFPVIVILIELADNLDDYLMRGLEPGAIALAYVYSLPDKIFLILPAAVLFATVFALGNMNRHSELAAAKASGRSFYRMFIPILMVSVVVAGGDSSSVKWHRLRPDGTSSSSANSRPAPSPAATTSSFGQSTDGRTPSVPSTSSDIACAT